MATTHNETSSQGFGASVRANVLALLRVITAAYFLAGATAMTLSPNGRLLFDAFLPQDQALTFTGSGLFGLGLALLLGLALRPVALLLLIYAVGAAVWQLAQNTQPQTTYELVTAVMIIVALWVLVLVAPARPEPQAAPRKSRVFVGPVDEAERDENIFSDDWDTSRASA